MQAARATARWVQRKLRARQVAGKVEQADATFLTGCVRLEIYARLASGVPQAEIMGNLDAITHKYAEMPLPKKIQQANNMMTVQIAHMFSKLRLVDTGDIPLVRGVAAPETKQIGGRDAPELLGDCSAADASAGAQDQLEEGSETSLSVPVRAASSESALSRAAEARELGATMRDMLTAATGHSLWLGPTQFPTPDDAIGVYLKGYAAPGTVVALYPGLVYNSEMMLRASDAGHLANPSARKAFIPRFDDTLINTSEADPVPSNPFALAHHVRHPPADIVPNVIRLQFDAMEEGGPLELDALPEELMQYVPNAWGSSRSLAKSFVNMTEQGIGMKCCVLVANRELLDEELFVDHQLNPFGPRPSWYTARDEEADRRLWSGLTSRS